MADGFHPWSAGTAASWLSIRAGAKLLTSMTARKESQKRSGGEKERKGGAEEMGMGEGREREKQEGEGREEEQSLGRRHQRLTSREPPLLVRAYSNMINPLVN